MSVQPAYLVIVKNLNKFLDALRHAQAPEKVKLKFVEDLGFTSTNDRLFIPLLKAMRFIDEGGKPTARYHAFLDDTEWKRILADGVRDAYPDLFRINREANKLSREQLTGKVKSLGEGKLSPVVLANIVRTFLELAKIGDFSAPGAAAPRALREDAAGDAPPPPAAPDRDPAQAGEAFDARHALVYRIEIVLPAVRDQAIYDAIFKSAKEHSLK